MIQTYCASRFAQKAMALMFAFAISVLAEAGDVLGPPPTGAPAATASDESRVTRTPKSGNQPSSEIHNTYGAEAEARNRAIVQSVTGRPSPSTRE